MANIITFCHVYQALKLKNFNSARAQRRMAPAPRGWQRRQTPPKPAAVLILLYPELDGRLHIVLTLRSSSLRGHGGQVSFPGGRQDAEDDSLAATALRETCEEVGLCSDEIRVMGELPRFYIPPSHYDVYPIVARYDSIPVFDLNPAEVAEVFSFALEDLLDPRRKHEEQRRIRGYKARIPYYDVKGHKVWGATAIMLSELEGRLRAAAPADVLLALS